MYNNINITKLLIQKGAKLDISDNDNKPILFIPIKYGYNDIMKTLLMANSESIGISIIDMKDSQHRTALHYAIKLKINLLLNYSLNINQIPTFQMVMDTMLCIMQFILEILTCVN